MKMILALLSAFLVSNLAHASDFELKVYFNLAAAEKHGMVRCAIGGHKLKTEYHLAVFKDKPSYTILDNLDLDKNVTGDVERKLLCDKGEFTLVKSINTTEDFINLLSIWKKFISLRMKYLMSQMSNYLPMKTISCKKIYRRIR